MCGLGHVAEAETPDDTPMPTEISQVLLTSPVAPTPAMMDREAPPPHTPPKPLADTKADADAYADRFWREYQETARPPDSRLYYDAERLHAQLVDGPDGRPAPVRLLRGSRLLARAHRLRKCTTDAEREKLRLPRRQELAEVEFLSSEEVQALRRGHVGDCCEACYSSQRARADRPLPIVAVAHGWLTAEHPDPFGEQLVRFAEQVEHERRWCPGGCIEVCFGAWGFCCTYGVSGGCCCFVLPLVGQRCCEVADQFPSGEFAVFYECARPRT